VRKAIDSITGDISYATGPFVASIGYAYAVRKKATPASSSPTARIEGTTAPSCSLLYNIAPGPFNSFTDWPMSGTSVPHRPGLEQTSGPPAWSRL